jgi:glycosyltransferase involved in cell wall biosynthesis
MKIALLTTDNREHYRSYAETMPHFGTAPEGLLQGFARMPEVEVHVISCARQKMTSPEKLAPNIWFHSLYVPRIGWTPTMFQGCIRAIRRKLKNIRPDIVHGQGTERDCALNAVFSGYPNVLTVHGNMRLIARVNRAKPLSFFWQAAQLEKVVLPRTDGVVCITRYTQDAVRDLARRTWVMPNAVDISFFDLQSAPDPARIILCVGLICYRKNQTGFIKSLDALAATSKFKLVFLGHAAQTDPCVPEFRDLVAKRTWCEHAGYADREKLKAWFQKAAILALPSLEDNCPMVVLEAMAAGVPVLAANVGGVPEIVTDGKTGIFCDPLDGASMRSGVSRLLDDPGLVRSVIANAREEADTRFHPLAIARGHVKIYEEVLGNRHPTKPPSP